MPKLPRVSGADVIRALGRLGFKKVRQRGSHVVLKRTGADGVTGTLRGILKQAGVSVEQFNEQL
jgi:predicted RNA binding protein YcfA (HicA-like mRNA interferase family)